MTVDLAPFLFAGAVGAVGLGILGYSVRGMSRGEIRPVAKSFWDDLYSRRTEPWGFRLSLSWNLLLSTVLTMSGLSAAFVAYAAEKQRPAREACLNDKQAPRGILTACERWMAEHRLDRFDQGLAAHRRAWAHAALGQTGEARVLSHTALGAYGRHLEVAPDDSGVYWNSAQLLLQLGEKQAAQASFIAYTQLEPDRGDGWLELGLTELALNKPQDAVRDLTRAIALLPGEARPIAARGIAHAFAGDNDRARADLDAARKLDPGYHLVGEAERMLARREAPETNAADTASSGN